MEKIFRTHISRFSKYGLLLFILATMILSLLKIVMNLAIPNFSFVSIMALFLFFFILKNYKITTDNKIRPTNKLSISFGCINEIDISKIESIE